MKVRPRIAIVGAGNFGTALALALRRAGYSIDVMIARSRAASLKRVRRLAERVGARAVTNLSGVSADLIWFCVPDGEIASAATGLGQNPRPFDKLRAGSLAKNARRTGHPGFEWTGKIALHASGALGSDELGVLRDLGAAVASVHPMMTFVGGSRPSLAGVSFAIEGDARAVRVARRVVNDLGGESYSIRTEDKAAYHAWGTFASPLLTALLATTERVAALAGVPRSEARRRMIPMLRQTLANYAECGAVRGFSGPIVRGDVDTVRRHLSVLRGTPAARAVYLELVRAAVQYLPGKNKRSLKRILGSSRD